MNVFKFTTYPDRQPQWVWLIQRDVKVLVEQHLTTRGFADRRLLESKVIDSSERGWCSQFCDGAAECLEGVA